MHSLNVIKNPNGTYSFVGSVPGYLGFIRKDGTTPTNEEITKDLMLPASYRKLKTRVFETEGEAWDAVSDY